MKKADLFRILDSAPDKFSLPLGHCSVCGYLFTQRDPDVAIVWDKELGFQMDGTHYFKCPVCKERLADYLRNVKKLQYSFTDLHRIAQDLYTLTKYTPRDRKIASLMKLIADARHFIHFETRTIDSFFLGLFYLASYRVTVKGTVGLNYEEAQRVNGYIRPLLRREVADEEERALFPEGFTGYYRAYAPNAEIHFDPRSNHESVHRKRVIIDGVVAITSSRNLTMNGWVSNIEGEDTPKVVSDLSEVVGLNNQEFSPSFFIVKKMRASQPEVS